MSRKANKNDSLQQQLQEEQNRMRKRQENRNAANEIDKRMDGPNRPST